MQPRLMGVLVALAEAYPDYVTREALLRRVWKVEHLSPQALNNAIAKLRAALGDPEMIQTERLAGYRLALAPVWRGESGAATQAVSVRGLVRAHPLATASALLIAGALAVSTWLMLSPNGEPLAQFLRDNPGNWVVEVEEPATR